MPDYHIDHELAASFNNLGLIAAENGFIKEALELYMEGLKYLGTRRVEKLEWSSGICFTRGRNKKKK